jgi:hypothetical protein
MKEISTGTKSIQVEASDKNVASPHDFCGILKYGITKVVNAKSQRDALTPWFMEPGG